MNLDEIIKEIKIIIEDITDISQDEISDDSAMIDDLDLSSIEIMSIIAEVERNFSIKISESEMLSISTVEELAEIVENKTEG